MYLKVFLIQFFIILCLQVFSQVPKLDHFDISSGLSSNIVFKIETDDEGKIWIGTNNGLNVFNGFEIREFSQIKTACQLKGLTVTALLNDNNGQVWILTVDGGLSKFDPKKECFTHYPDSLMNGFGTENINSISVINDEVAWIQNGIALGYFDIRQNTFKIHKNLIPIKGLCKYDSTTTLYYGDFGFHKVSLKNGVVADKQISSEAVYAVKNINDGFLMATETGIVKTDKNLNNKTLLIPAYALNVDVSSVSNFALTENYLWIGCVYGLFRESLHTLNKGTITTLNTSIINEHITSLKVDKAENLWISTPEKGIYFYSKNKNSFNFIDWNFTPKNIFTDNYNRTSDPISSICKTKEGDIWVGSSKSGIGIIGKNGEKRIFLNYVDQYENSKRLKLIRCIIEDTNGTIWITSMDGCLYYNKEKDRIESISYKYKWDWPYISIAVKEVAPGQVILTGGKFIGIIDINTGEIEVLPTISNGVYLWDIFFDIELDDKDNLWLVQSHHGLVKINKNRDHYTTYLKENGDLNDNKIFDIAIHGDSILMATKSGLSIFSIEKEELIKTYTKTDGLSSNLIYSVRLDKEDNVWMSTNRGINKLSTKTNIISSYIVNNTYSNFSYFFEDSTIYYGGFNGLTFFNPKDITYNAIRTKPVIENFKLFNKEVHVGDTIGNRILLEKSVNSMKRIVLNHKQNSFTFVFNSYPFEYPNNIKFKYRLIEIQNEWFYASDRSRNATYTLVPPGNYQFEISASVSENQWSEAKVIQVDIIPPIWQRTWFIVSLIAFVILLAGSIIWYRISAIKRANIILEKRVEEQTQELKDQTIQLQNKNEKIQEISRKLHEADESKLRFFTNISHEFRTPLTIILGYLEKLNDNKKSNDIGIIRRNAKRLLELINQLLEMRKMDLDKLELNVCNFDIIEYSQSIVNSFQLTAEQKKVDLHFYSEHQQLEVWLDKDKIEKILYNLISNAIKYTPENKSVIVEIRPDNEDVLLIIQDEGIGISEEDLENIFDRFYRSRTQTQTGHGIGLSLSKGLIEMQHGKITVASEINKGSKFTVRFKKGKNHFKESDFGQTESQAYSTIQNPLTRVKDVTKFSGKEILVVEDNLELSEYFVELLQTEFSVKHAPNGKMALDILSEHTPDLIISDILMPVMDGIEFCSRVKANIETSHIPFILLTAKTNAVTQVEGFRLGIDDFIEKPFNPHVLLARITAILSNREHLQKHLLSGISENPKINKGLSKRDKEFWEQINQFIKENYSDPDFSASSLSKLMNISRANFYRKFKGLTGLNIAEHIRKHRLQKALELIREGELDITQISIHIGYKTPAQFRHSFKEEYGKNPNEFLA